MTNDLFCENTMSTVMEQNPGDQDLELWKEQLVANLKVKKKNKQLLFQKKKKKKKNVLTYIFYRISMFQ
jgi:hypothetical protein